MKTTFHSQEVMAFQKVALRLVEFVLCDQRFKQLGLHGGAAAVFREVCGREPTNEEIHQAVRHFWQVWHDRFDNQRPRPVGGGSPHETLEELSPAQENAIRALEDWFGVEPNPTADWPHH